MLLHDLSTYLSDRFSLENSCYALDERMFCYTFDFVSDICFSLDDKDIPLESGEKENQHFRYAIFAPGQTKKFSEAILLLHGLNERSWGKYLPWAYQLAMQTQKPVILFPIAYHINRSPQTWNAPRLMDQHSIFRKTTIPSMVNSSFANAALSVRMDHHPEYFALSGIQTYFDIVKLVSAIKAGDWELFENDCHIDFFAYSIGALLTETLLISNPLELFGDSRAFFFCGGSTFDTINGCSRSIMDSQAFASLRNHTLNHPVLLKKRINIPEQQIHLLKDGWQAFLAMSGIEKYAVHRENAFNWLVNRIKTIGLKKDCIVPGYALRDTFGKIFNHRCFEVDIMDFPFDYSHEVPFPAHNQRLNSVVTQSFLMVFTKAAQFLS
ncbi:MAG: DUF6051 family protein [Bacteroidetes bacterium]|nr:DUF6051 family protein [Bacteroidota bacterium]